MRYHALMIVWTEYNGMCTHTSTRFLKLLTQIRRQSHSLGIIMRDTHKKISNSVILWYVNMREQLHVLMRYVHTYMYMYVHTYHSHAHVLGITCTCITSLLSHTLSLSLSLTHTHTHTYTYTQAHTHRHRHSPNPSGGHLTRQFWIFTSILYKNSSPCLITLENKQHPWLNNGTQIVWSSSP